MELKTKNQSVDTPESWAQTPLKNICTLHNGRAFHRSEWESQGTPVIRLQNLTGGDDYYYSTLNLPSNKYCSEGDLLYMWSASFGPMIWKGPEAIYHYHIWKVDINADAASKNFLYFKLDEITQRLKERETSGSTMLHLTKQKMEKTEVLLPPLPEQRAIAEALSDVDALIERLDALIAKKRAIKTATMQRLLTGQQRLPGFSAPWTTKRLGEVFDLLQTANNSRKDLSDHGDVAYIHYGDIHTFTKSHLDLKRDRLPFIEASKVHNAVPLQDGDLVMVDASEDYEGVGKSVEVSGLNGQSAVAGLHTFLLRGDDAYLADGFKGYMQHMPNLKEALHRIATGTSVYGISKTKIKDIDLRLPPVEEQNAIATILSDIDAEIEVLEARRDKTQSIKQGMMQELLTGRTRLV